MGSCEQRDEVAAEIGQVVGAATADVVPVDHDRSVFEDRSSVDEVILDAGRSGHANAAVDTGRDRDPATVANRGDRLFRGVKVSNESMETAVAGLEEEVGSVMNGTVRDWNGQLEWLSAE